ncbi:MdtA/MuxA family multidrug efflux RND transporter periplasmic adaptor subunit [Methylobacter sp. BlB1]|uniref:MdtA/MuxA family multidrug efflux RND transporter periplasmic adaptor subunit n=1 Tax=Methylobacter sp. BlB1 TaxID=2785914 RepID=UPI001893DC87|nr:MdtA/MuxA family multidrug efflux RND transporter periplasmic adaptor subunit [Methylobacter sp. BlB1]MBF6647643.1 MdtA/MuxA family multidrug efflux RND transporter periplasmic adaptor subunit [Methylobacter sp. BlB1]
MKSRNLKLLLIGLAVLLSIITAAYLIKPRNDQPQQQNAEKPGKPDFSTVAVVAEPARQGDFPIYLNGLGTVTALNTATIRSRVDGELIRVAFQEGQVVREGDLLAEIDPRPFQAQLMQAEGQLLRDEALLKNAQLDLERYQTLLEQDSIAAQQTATQEALVRQYRGTVETDRGLIADAKLQLTYTRITAPFTGRLGLRLVDKGNIVKTSDTNGLVVLTQIQPITVVFTLPEADLPAVMKRLRAGETLPIEAYDRSGNTRLSLGKLVAVDNQIDIATGTIRFKAQFDNKDHALFPNQFVNVRMTVDTLRDATIIPAAAIQRGTPGAFAYVVKEDKTVSVRPLKLGPAEAEKVAVLEGLKPGEQVVVDGIDKLREGARVDLVNREPARPAS